MSKADGRCRHPPDSYGHHSCLCAGGGVSAPDAWLWNDPFHSELDLTLPGSTRCAANAPFGIEITANGYFLDATVATRALSGSTPRHNAAYGYDASLGAAGAPIYSRANAYLGTNCYRHNASGGTGGSILGAPAQPGCFQAQARAALFESHHHRNASARLSGSC